MKYAMMPHVWDTVTTAMTDAGHELVDDLANADALVWNGPAEEFPELPESIGFVQLCLAGIDAFFDQGIITPDRKWANASGIFGRTVAESAVALLLSQLHCHVWSARAKTWSVRRPLDDATSWLYDHTVAIVGAGGIGRDLIPMLKGFGCNVIAVNRSGRPLEGADETIPTSELDSVYGRADYFIYAAPLTEETRHMVNAETLSKMPEHAVVVNVGRGPLVDTDALVEALEAGKIRGAALDVTEPEPLPDGHPLWDMDNVVITPHTANTAERIRTLIAPYVVKNVAAFEKGKKMPTEVEVGQGY